LRAVKAVKFSYAPTEETRELLETFRMMVNDAIRIALQESIRGRLKLRDRIYREFRQRYGIVSCYPYSVAEVTWSIVKKHRRWQRRPFAKRAMLKMDAASYSIIDGVLNLPNRKGQRLLIPLGYGDFQRNPLTDKTLKRGSVTMTESKVIVAFSKESEAVEPTGKVGYDLNQNSLVGADGSKNDLSEVARLHTEYGVRRSEFYAKYSGDRRLKKKFASTRRERERAKQFLHRVAKEVIERATERKQAIILERLKGIRYAHRRGNGKGRGSRRRIALWPFRQLQGYIEYKAMWAGLPVEYVNASTTSQICSNCAFVNKKLKLTQREWRCPQCGCQLDRDLNAAANIERRGKIPCLGEVRPGARGIDEAVKGNGMTTPILRAEVPKLGS
jgi:IS605 OrfB family transposase